MKLLAIYQAAFASFATEMENDTVPDAVRDTVTLLMNDPTITQYVSGVMARPNDTGYDFEDMDTYSLCDGHDRLELADDHAQFFSDIADYGNNVVGAYFILFDHGVLTVLVYTPAE
jgi:hypothetical protein